MPGSARGISLSLGAGVWNDLPWCQHLPENRQLIARVASDEILDIAFDWVCKRRVDYSHNSDIWDLRWNWQEIKPKIQQALVSGDYTFSALKEIRTDSDIIELWCATDALVLKALAIVLGEHLDEVISDKCHHVQGRGGAKQAIRSTMKSLTPGDYVMKSDVKSYYASIDHEVLDALKLEKHPDKTFIGRAKKGFDFLGYHFEPGSLTPSCQTIKKHAERICRLYEQGADDNRIRQYVRRWVSWLFAGWSSNGMQYPGGRRPFHLNLDPGPRL